MVTKELVYACLVDGDVKTSFLHMSELSKAVLCKKPYFYQVQCM